MIGNDQNFLVSLTVLKSSNEYEKNFYYIFSFWGFLPRTSGDKKNSSTTPDAPKEKCKQNKSDFEISMNSCAPRFTLDYHEKKLINEGPNCWGTAMSF